MAYGMKKLRLDKYLADMQAGTRSEVRQMVRKGRVFVNGIPVRTAEFKVDPCADRVELDGVCVDYIRTEYWMLNKPKGTVSATEDRRERTVLELLPDTARRDLFPVGRLDKNTTGLLLLTNDGALAHSLLSPKRHVDKTYEAVVSGRPGKREQEMFAQGLDIGDEKPTLPAVLQTDGISDGKNDMSDPSDGEEKQSSTVRITIREGRYHQIKRMFEAVGMKVLELKRLSMGPLVLDSTLGEGQARRLTEDEILALKRIRNCDKTEIPQQENNSEE